MNPVTAFETALRLALFAAATLAMLGWTGYGPAAFLLPLRLRPLAPLLLAPIGYCWFALASSLLNSTLLPMGTATWAILAAATVANLAAWRFRCLPLAFTRETAAIAAVAWVPFLISAAPLVKAGSTAFVGAQWDLEVYLPITEYLKRYAIGARLDALPNPLTTLLNAPDFRGGSGWGFSYVEAGVGTLLGWPSYLTFRPLLHLLMTLSVPCVWVLARAVFGLERRAAFLVAALWSVHGLGIWLAAIGLAGHTAALGLLPLALALSFLALDEPEPRTVLLAGSVAAGLLLNFYTGAAPFYALPVAAYGLVRLTCGPARQRTVLTGAALLATILVLAPVAHLRFVEALSVYAGRGLTQGWNIQRFSPVAEALGLSPFLLVQQVTELGVILGEPGYDQFLQAGWHATQAAGVVALAGLAVGPMLRLRYLCAAVPLLALAAVLRFGMAYPYGYFKALSLIAPLLLVPVAAGAVAAWDALAASPHVRPFRVPLRLVLGAGASAFLGMMLFTTWLSVRYFWTPSPEELPRSVWQLQQMKDRLPQGAPVQVLSRSGFNARTAGMVAYFLVDNPLDGALTTAYHRMTPRQPGQRFDYVLVLDGVQAQEAGLDPEAALWRNELAALYRAPETWQAAAYLEGSDRVVRVGEAAGAAELQLTADRWGITAPSGREVAGDWWRPPQPVQPEFTFLSVTGGTLRFTLPDGERTVRLTPGLHTYRLPPIAMPGTVRMTTERPDESVHVLSARLVAPQDAGGTLVSVQGITALELAASTEGGFGLTVRYASPDPRGGDVVVSVEVYQHGASGTLTPFAAWEVAHAGRQRHGRAVFHLDPQAWTCTGGHEDSQAPPDLRSGTPPDGVYTVHLALYHMGDDVARWPWVRFAVRAGQVMVERETALPSLAVAYLPAPREVLALRARIPEGAEVLVVPDRDPDRSFITAAAGFLDGRRVVADAPLPRPDLFPAQLGRVHDYGLLPADVDPTDYGYEPSSLVWSNRFARLYVRSEGSPNALYRFPQGLDLAAGETLRLARAPGGSRLDLPDGRSVWGFGPDDAASSVDIVVMSTAPQPLAVEHARPGVAPQVSASVRDAPLAVPGPGVFTYHLAAAAQPGDLVLHGSAQGVTVLAVRVSRATPGLDGLAPHPETVVVRARPLDTEARPAAAFSLDAVAGGQDAAAPAIVGLDVYSRGQCALTHYGYWALVLPERAAQLDVRFGAPRAAAEFRSPRGALLSTEHRRWPAGDGLYRAVLFVRVGERTEMLPTFQFRMVDQRVTEVTPLLNGQVHWFRHRRQ